MYPRSSSLFDQVSSRGGKIEKFTLIARTNNNRQEPYNFDLKNWKNSKKLNETKLLGLARFEKKYDSKQQERNSRVFIKMEDTQWYQMDYLGVRTLDTNGRFLKLHMPGDHDMFSMLEAEEMFPKAMML